MTSLKPVKQPMEYFNFRCYIQLHLPVVTLYNIPLSTPESKDEEYYDDDDEYTMHVVPLNPPEGDPNANWQWCLLTLDGNATILQLRKEDFVRYLKMNLASLIGKELKHFLMYRAVKKDFTPEIEIFLYAV